MRLLFWLKWQLMWRTYRRHMSAAVGAILAVIILLPMSLVIAGGALAGFLLLDPPLNQHLLRAVLLMGYLMWLMAPLMGYELTEDYDITKLLLYPLTPRQIFVGTILGSLLDFMVIFSLPTMVAILVGFTKSFIAFPIVLAAVVLSMFHTVALSQVINLATAGMLRSRRFRDIMIVLVPLVWITIYVGWQMLTQRAHEVNWQGFIQSSAWEVVGFLPPGITARAIAAAGNGRPLVALAFLCVIAAIAIGTVYLAGWLVNQVYAGEVVSAAVRRRAAPRQAAARASASQGRPTSAPLASRSVFGMRLPPVAQAVMDKEIKYLIRDPFFKAMLMQSVYMIIIFGFAFLQPWRRQALDTLNLGPIAAWGLIGFLLLSEAPLPFNILGTEGASAMVLFLFPGSRRQILLGKNLALLAALSIVNGCFVIVLALLAKATRELLPLLLWGELATVMFVSVGNLVSLWFPYRIVMRGWRVRPHSASRGFSYGLAHLGMGFVVGVVSLPVAAALIVPTHWVHPVWFAVTVPFAIGYAVGAYLLSLHLASALLLRREVEIAEILAQTE